MAGFVASGATFTFNGVAATITRLSVETPAAEIVDMTAHNAPTKQLVLVPTGDWRGGAIDIDYIYAAGGTDPQTVVGTVGQATFASPRYSVARRVILESATTEASVGALVQGTLRFRVTDYAGT